MTSNPRPAVADFIKRWESSAAAERANYQLFLSELCDVLDVPRPDPTQPDDDLNAYVFERAVTFHNGDGTTSSGRIDLYKRACFVLEAKQGSEEAQPGLDGKKKKLRKGTATRGTGGWDDAMLAARGQAEQYAKALPASEGWPPFLVVVDVGYTVELYADFTRTGKAYIPFPDPRSHRISMQDLKRDEIRERLRLVWTDPLTLDPTRRSAKVTREVAGHLAVLARSLEESGHTPGRVAHFLMRCIFTMFAEDVRLLPQGSFHDLLLYIRREGLEFFPHLVGDLWEKMNTGGVSPVLRQKLLRFNGGLFESCEALPLSREQLDLLLIASTADWRDVEPAIFGTLLERALDPVERHKLGAHYTPRAYVERLVMPTLVEPLREEWEAVRVAAVTLANDGKTKEAVAEIRAFHRRLCEIRVLDPACGSGNFLYVALEHMKRLEGEVFQTLADLGEVQGVFEMEGVTVDPHQFLGIEINPRAAAITDLVLWIGYLQWHFRTRGDALPDEPVIRKFHNIECRDAVLAYDGTEPVLDENGQPVSRWDGRSFKKHPVTGQDVPDEAARISVLRYLSPRKAEWPLAEFVVGNPPFIGNWRMRQALGEGYTEALRSTYADVPDSSDYVMYWWDQAASLARSGHLRRFGFIATNSLTQALNRRVVQRHLVGSDRISLVFAIPDHPWVDASDGADVRISMTVAQAGGSTGLLQRVLQEKVNADGETQLTLSSCHGSISSDLRIGADVSSAVHLRAMGGISSRGVSLHGSGFILTRNEAANLGLGRVQGLERWIREYRNGRDIAAVPRDVLVIDLYGLSENEVRQDCPELYQWISERVKPERDSGRGRTADATQYASQWWLFGKTRPELRKALSGLTRYIATVETSRRRFFLFLDASILPDNKLVCIASDDAFCLGVLSSRIHVAWALASGSRLGIGNDPVYVKSACFEKFPFPDSGPEHSAHIRALGETLEAHRKRQQERHPGLTLSAMYSVLSKLREGESLNEKEKAVYEQGLIAVLKQLHDDLDAAVLDAYGWPHNLTDEEVLERLVALNAERAAEERRGLVRWLRPEFQNPQGGGQAALETGEGIVAPVAAPKVEKQDWPRTLAEQARAVRSVLLSFGAVATPEDVATRFNGARKEKIGSLLETLASLGQAREVAPGRYAAS